MSHGIHVFIAIAVLQTINSPQTFIIAKECNKFNSSSICPTSTFIHVAVTSFITFTKAACALTKASLVFMNFRQKVDFDNNNNNNNNSELRVFDWLIWIFRDFVLLWQNWCDHSSYYWPLSTTFKQFYCNGEDVRVPLCVCVLFDLRLHVWVPRERVSGRQSSDDVTSYRLPARILSTHTSHVHIFYSTTTPGFWTDWRISVLLLVLACIKLVLCITASETIMPART